MLGYFIFTLAYHEKHRGFNSFTPRDRDMFRKILKDCELNEVGF